MGRGGAGSDATSNMALQRSAIRIACVTLLCRSRPLNAAFGVFSVLTKSWYEIGQCRLNCSLADLQREGGASDDAPECHQPIALWLLHLRRGCSKRAKEIFEDGGEWVTPQTG